MTDWYDRLVHPWTLQVEVAGHPVTQAFAPLIDELAVLVRPSSNTHGGAAWSVGCENLAGAWTGTLSFVCSNGDLQPTGECCPRVALALYSEVQRGERALRCEGEGVPPPLWRPVPRNRAKQRGMRALG